MGKKGWGKFVIGAGIGAGLGLLFAPKKGSELRADLKVKADELIKKAKEIDVKEVEEKITKKINELKSEVKDLDKEKVLKIAKEKGEQIKEKASELVTLAKEKGTPMIHDAALEVKEKAIAVAKDAINRLEKKESKE